MFDRIRDEFVNENIIIDGITDTATNDSNGQSQGGNGRDEVLCSSISAKTAPWGLVAETAPDQNLRQDR